MTGKFLAVVIGMLLLAGVAVVFVISRSQKAEIPNVPPEKIKTVSDFDECIAAGNPVMESYPRRCNAGGQVFVEDVGNELENSDLIVVSNPRPNQIVKSPLEVTGEARGTWYFEASFPVYLHDGEGNEIAVGIAEAQSDWMTEDYVQFKVTLEFDVPDTAAGDIIFEKNNPSGLPEHDESLSFPVRFR